MPTVRLDHYDHGDVAVEDVVCDRAQETNDLRAFDCDEGDLRASHQLGEDNWVRDSSTPIVCLEEQTGGFVFGGSDGADVHMMPNVRAKLPAEAGGVSLVRVDAPCAADQAYSACRSGSA